MMVSFGLIGTIIAVVLQHHGLAMGQYTGPTLACGGTSLLKTTTLIAPQNVATNGMTCVYTIRSLNLRICQVRLDFNSFSLAQPTLDPYPTCINDVLTVDNLNFNLCGENSGQHLYVPFNPTSADRTMTITFRIASRAQIPTLTNPHWSVRVQQLECPTGLPAGGLRSLLEPEPTLNDIAPRTTHDLGALAPVGCLQYFTAPSGTVESFNLGANGAGPYLGGLSYAICFQRTRSTSRLHFTASTFELGYSADPTETNVGFDELCYSNVASPGRSEDNLHIPNAGVQLPSLPPIRAERFCSRSLLNADVDVKSPGPFTVYFNSDRQFDASRPEAGFRMHYQLS
uniref:CUB domain-containing protein n=1 Tax=Anopheles albimanus TaxID=7167 RepID=A0A182F2W1_ANOAL